MIEDLNEPETNIGTEFVGTRAERREASQAIQPVSFDHPLFIAWENYKKTDDYKNNLHWAIHNGHTEGALWGAFYVGFSMGRPPGWIGSDNNAKTMPKLSHEQIALRSIAVSLALANKEQVLTSYAAQARATAERAIATGEHGSTCRKVIHGAGGGFLHGSDDDTPYDVDGLAYCGRCHVAL